MSFTYPTCYVHNLPRSATDKTVEELFKSCDGVDRTVLKRDRKGRSLCYALAVFDNVDSLAMAVETLKGTWIDGNLITMSFVNRNSAARRKPTTGPFITLRDRPTSVYVNNVYQPPSQFNTDSYKYNSSDPDVLAELARTISPHKAKELAAHRLSVLIGPFVTLYNDHDDVLKYLTQLDIDLQFKMFTDSDLLYHKVDEARNYYRRPCANEREVLSLNDVDQFKNAQQLDEPVAKESSQSEEDEGTRKRLVTAYPRFRRRLALRRLEEMAKNQQNQQGRDDVVTCVEDVYPGNPNNPIIVDAVLGIPNDEYRRIIGDRHKLREKVTEMGAVINDVRSIQYQQPLDVPQV